MGFENKYSITEDPQILMLNKKLTQKLNANICTPSLYSPAIFCTIFFSLLCGQLSLKPYIRKELNFKCV
jgi:hypothetical protein